MREEQHDRYPRRGREKSDAVQQPSEIKVEETRISRDTKKIGLMIIDKVDEEADIGPSHAQRQHSTGKSKSVHGDRGTFHKQKHCAVLHDQVLRES
jgi:hypothetical protein